MTSQDELGLFHFVKYHSGATLALDVPPDTRKICAFCSLRRGGYYLPAKQIVENDLFYIRNAAEAAIIYIVEW